MIDPAYSEDAQPRDLREFTPPESPVNLFEIFNDRTLHELKTKVLDLEDEVEKLKTSETEIRDKVEVLKKEKLEQDDKITALQELVMELCNKTDIHGGLETYWEVKQDLED